MDRRGKGQSRPETPLRELIEAACLKFDLSPMTAEHLLRAVKAHRR